MDWCNLSLHRRVLPTGPNGFAAMHRSFSLELPTLLINRSDRLFSLLPWKVWRAKSCEPTEVINDVWSIPLCHHPIQFKLGFNRLDWCDRDRHEDQHIHLGTNHHWERESGSFCLLSAISGIDIRYSTCYCTLLFCCIVDCTTNKWPGSIYKEKKDSAELTAITMLPSAFRCC